MFFSKKGIKIPSNCLSRVNVSLTGSFQMQGSPGVTAVTETLAMSRGYRDASRAVASGTRVDKAGGCGLCLVCLTITKGQTLVLRQKSEYLVTAMSHLWARFLVCKIMRLSPFPLLTSSQSLRTELSSITLRIRYPLSTEPPCRSSAPSRPICLTLPHAFLDTAVTSSLKCLGLQAAPGRLWSPQSPIAASHE